MTVSPNDMNIWVVNLQIYICSDYCVVSVYLSCHTQMSLLVNMKKIYLPSF